MDDWLTTMHDRGHDALHHALDPAIASVGNGLKDFMDSNHETLVPEVTAHDLSDDFVEGIKYTVEEVEHGVEGAVEGLKHFEQEAHQSFEPEVPASEFGHLLEEQIGITV